MPSGLRDFFGQGLKKNDGEGGGGWQLRKNLPWNTKKSWVGDTMMICIMYLKIYIHEVFDIRKKNMDRAIVDLCIKQKYYQ